jgi:hypothetical protein
VSIWTIGVADRLRFPRFPSQLGKWAFAHIPTGTTTNHKVEIDEVNSRLVNPAVVPTATGPTETDRATP